MLAVALSALSCGKPPPPPVMGPPEVSVMHPIRRETTDYLNYDGITRGVKQTEVRPRVNGYLEKVLYKPDTQVKAGQPLFLIDQRPYKVAKQRAEAERAGKRAMIDSTRAELDRVRKLAEQQAASEQERLNRQAAYDLAVAEVQTSEAELAAAELNLTYTEIKAEIAGRVSRNLVDEGTLLKENEQVLCTIVNDDQIYVDFNVSESEYLEWIRKNPKSRTEDAGKVPVVIEMGMADQSGYPNVGRVVSGDNTVDPSTATFAVRAMFENADKQIAPGLYVRVRAVNGRSESILVPDAAVQSDARGQFVMVIGEKDLVERRGVVPARGAKIGEYRRIVEGLTEQDRVIVNGLQRARPGAPVKINMVEGPKFVEGPAPATLPTTQPATQPQ